MLLRIVRFLILLVLAAAAPEQVSAHAVLLHAAPADGARLASSPERIDLRFNEPVRLRALRLAGTGGVSTTLISQTGAETGAETGVAETVSAGLPPLGPGSYVVSWRLSSADGHPVAGSLTFSIGQAATVPGGAVAAPDAGMLAILHPTARTAAFAASLTAAGAVLFLALFGRNPAVHAATRRFTLGGTVLAAATVLFAAAAGRAILDGEGLATAAAMLAAEWIDAGPDPASALRLAGLALVALGAAVPRATVVAGVAGAVAVAASFGLTGHTAAHAASRGQPWLQALLAVHLLGVAFWIGALWPLLRATHSHDRAAVVALMARFSAVAMAVVPLLVLAGLTAAAVLVGGWTALVATGYGRLLGAKVLLVGAMLGLAAANRWRLVPALAADDDAPARLRRSIGSEIVLAVAVFAVTAAMTSMPPPSRMSPEPVPAVTATASAGSLGLVLSVSPGLPGTNGIVLRIMGADGAPFDPQRATLRLSSPALGIEEIIRPMDRTGPGAFHHEGPELALAGNWLATVDLLIDDFERRRVEFPIALGVGEHHAH